MRTEVHGISRRPLVCGIGGFVAMPAFAQPGLLISLADFQAPGGQGEAGVLQHALDELAGRGGGTLRIGGTFRGGIAVIRGSGITIDGAGGTLVDTRLVITPEARDISVRDLTVLETRGSAESYLLDISGRNCTFTNLSLIKRPMAGGYQAYLRGASEGCRFLGLRLEGSNGIFVAGRDHLFQNFDFTSTLRSGFGGDDAFAIKAPGLITENIVIKQGTVRGFSAAVSIGSEVGSNLEHRGLGIVRKVTVQDIVADRCQMVCFIKPGALIYDWRNGLVEDVSLDNIRLTDRSGFLYTRGVAITAGRGARVRRFTARGIVIAARAQSQGVMPTAAIDLNVRSHLPAATIEDIDLQLTYSGAGRDRYPVDQIVRVEKDDPRIGAMRNVVIDVTGSDARFAGIYVGPGLDDAVTISRARLSRVALDPPSSLGAAGIWSDSRVRLGDVQVDAIRAPARGGRSR